ncbi:hypothetical protein ACH5RR_026382 [Cinchona calisaya]|uniref:Uncharacterized protein n=1 Tax=Cinchona calisaya TaxID=153742 RepID=A0ABD2Z2E6_9GENT
MFVNDGFQATHQLPKKSQVDLALVVLTVSIPNPHQKLEVLQSQLDLAVPVGHVGHQLDGISKVDLLLTYHSNPKVSVDASPRVSSLTACPMQVDDRGAYNLSGRQNVIEGAPLLMDDQHAKFCHVCGKKTVQETDILDSLLDTDVVEQKNSTKSELNGNSEADCLIKNPQLKNTDKDAKVGAENTTSSDQRFRDFGCTSTIGNISSGFGVQAELNAHTYHGIWQSPRYIINKVWQDVMLSSMFRPFEAKAASTLSLDPNQAKISHIIANDFVWAPPAATTLKFKVDVSAIGNPSSVDGGGLIRRLDGSLIAGFVNSFGVTK